MKIEDIAAIETRLKAILHGEFSSLTISFNDHASNCCDVATAIDDELYDHADWVSQEEKERALAENSAWMIIWWPHGRTSHCGVVASTLAACIDAAAPLQDITPD